MHLVTSRLISRDQDFVQEELSEESLIDDFDLVEEETKHMEFVLQKPDAEVEAEVNAGVVALSPLREQYPEPQVFFIDTEHYLARNQ